MQFPSLSRASELPFHNSSWCSNLGASKAFLELPAHNDLSYPACSDSLATRLASVGFLDCQGRCYDPCPAPFLILNPESGGQSSKGSGRPLCLFRTGQPQSRHRGKPNTDKLPSPPPAAASLVFAMQLFGEVRLWSVTLQGPATFPAFQGHQRLRTPGFLWLYPMAHLRCLCSPKVRSLGLGKKTNRTTRQKGLVPRMGGRQGRAAVFCGEGEVTVTLRNSAILSTMTDVHPNS